MRFLQLDPYSYYYCNCKDGCRCKSLNYDFGDDGKKCVDCGHGKMNHYCWWNKHIGSIDLPRISSRVSHLSDSLGSISRLCFVLWTANPIKNHGYSGPGASAMKLLKSELLDSCLLRRTKKERSADISLPVSSQIQF